MRTAKIGGFAAFESSPRQLLRSDAVSYWISTGIVSAIMLWSAFNFAFNPAMKGAFAHLGLPNWFRAELTTAKFLGSFALILPITPHRIKEFAYFGFALTLISASIARLSSGDSFVYVVAHSMFLVSLAVSYRQYHRRIGATATM
jgi:DoxX-like family